MYIYIIYIYICIIACHSVYNYIYICIYLHFMNKHHHFSLLYSVNKYFYKFILHIFI